MKFRKTVIFCLLLLAIVAIGAASASEKIADNTAAAIEPCGDAISQPVEEIGPADEAVSDSAVEEEPTEATQAVEEIEIGDNANSDEQLTSTEDDFETRFYNINGFTTGVLSVNSRCHKNGTMKVYVNGTKKAEFSLVNGSFGEDWEPDGDGYEDVTIVSYRHVYLPDLKITDSGTYKLKVTFKGDSYATETTLGESTVSVLRCLVSEEFDYMSYGETLQFIMNFPGIKSGNVSVYSAIPSAQPEKSELLGTAKIVNGTATCPISGQHMEDRNFYIEYSTNMGSGNISWTILARKNTGNVAVTVSPTTLYVGSNPVIKLKSNVSGDLRIYVDGKLTRFKDVSSKTYSIPKLAVGTHTVKIVFLYSYDTFYSNTFKIKVKAKVATKIVAAKKTFKVKTKVKKYIITLKAGKKLVKNVKVTLKVGKKTYKATTNSKGKATFKLTKLKKKGKYTATIKFAGNNNYKASSKKIKITVKK